MGAPLDQQKVWRRAFVTLLLVIMFTTGCLGVGQDEVARSGDDSADVHLTVWYTFAAESKEEQVFLESIRGFQDLHPNITVDATLIPYDDAVNQFKTAAIGGEAPDLMRLSSDQLGSIGEVRVDGFPLLEDLRPHLTPAERQLYAVQALHALSLIHI